MYIKKLQGTFGCLENKTLTLERGLNVIYAPNESGKSTWCAFIRAMLYGISSRERAKSGFLPDRERYRPWSGSEMYGRMLISKDNEDIEIERRSESSAFSSCVSKNLTTGELAPEGEELCGVSRGVYERTAFIGQTGAFVDADADTSHLILSLASSGEENVAAEEVIARLSKARRAVRSPRGLGSLPDTEREIERLSGETVPSSIRGLYDEVSSLELSAERKRREEKDARLLEAEAELRIKDFPMFDGMSDSLAESMAERDAERASERVRAKGAFVPVVFLVLAAVSVFFAVAADFRLFAVSAALVFMAAVSSVFLLVSFFSKKKKLRRELVSRYGTYDAEKILALSRGYAAAFAALEKAERDIGAAQGELESAMRKLIEKRAEWEKLYSEAKAETAREKEKLLKKQEELTLLYDALSLAEETMQASAEIMRERISPSLERLCAEYFRRLCGGSFDTVRIKDASLTMEVSRGEASSPKSTLSLSRGTFDELYFSLRLAMCTLALGEQELPVVLDDAFVNFDDTRLHRALDLLSERAEHEQIILFTCHKREAEYLRGRENVSITEL